jgi:hypothetical protein
MITTVREAVANLDVAIKLFAYDEKMYCVLPFGLSRYFEYCMLHCILG